MAGRNRTVKTVLALPRELLVISQIYQSERNFASRNQAIVELLETHPRVVDIMRDLGYDGLKGKGHETGV